MIRSLGIDIAAKSIKIAEVHFSAGKRRVVDLVQIPIDRDKGPWGSLRDFIISRPQKEEHFALGLGKTPVVLKKFSFPFSDRHKVEASMRADFEDSLPFELTDYQLNFKLVSKAGKMHEYVAGLCHIADLDALNKNFEEIFLRPDHLGVDAEAIGQLALHQVLPGSESVDPYLIIDVGYSSTKLAFVRGQRGGEFFKGQKNTMETLTDIMEMRCLGRGSSEIVEWMADRKNMSIVDAEKWLQSRAEILMDSHASSDVSPMSLETSDEIKTALRPVIVEIYQTVQSFRGQYGIVPTVAYVTGGVTQLPGFKEFLANELRIKIETWDFFKGFETDRLNLTHTHRNEFGLALSFAHRFTLNKSRGWLNFKRSPVLQRKFLTQGISFLGRADVRPVVGFFVGFWIFLALYMAASNYLLSTQVTEVRKILVTEFQKLDPDLGRKAQKSVLDIKQTQQLYAVEVKKRMNRVALGDASRAKLEFLLDLSEILPSKTQIKNLQLENQGNQQKLVSHVFFQEKIEESQLKRIKESLDTEFKERGYSSLKVDGTSASLKITAGWGGAKRGTVE